MSQPVLISNILEWTCVVNMDSLPGDRGVFPRMMPYFRWIRSNLAATETFSGDGFDIRVDIRPPNITSGECFHFDDSGMRLHVIRPECGYKA